MGCCRSHVKDSSESSDSESSECCSECPRYFPNMALFVCETCERNPLYSVTSRKKLLCEQCIASHIQKGHEVTDRNGHTPPTCDTHHKLCVLYCNDCEQLFCSCCRENHANHKTEKVDKRAEVVQKRIQKLMERFERNSESLSYKQQLLKALSSSRSDRLQNFFESVGSKLEDLKVDLTSELTHFSEAPYESLNRTTQNYAIILKESLKELTELQILSHGTLVSEFQEQKLSFEERLAALDALRAINFGAPLKPSDESIQNLEALICEFKTKFMEEIKSRLPSTSICKPGTLTELSVSMPINLTDSFYLNGFHSNFFFEVSGSIGGTKISKWTLQTTDEGPSTFCKSELTTLRDVRGIDDVYHLSYCNLLILQPHKCDVQVFDYYSNSTTSRALPPYPNILSPYTLGALRRDHIYWCYQKSAKIRFSHNSRLSISSDQKLTRQDVIGENSLLFLTSSNDVLYLSGARNEKIELRHEDHGMERVDQVVYISATLLLWEFQKQMVAVWGKSEGGQCFGVRKLFSWKSQHSLILKLVKDEQHSVHFLVWKRRPANKHGSRNKSDTVDSDASGSKALIISYEWR